MNSYFCQFNHWKVQSQKTRESEAFPRFLLLLTLFILVFLIQQSQYVFFSDQ